VARRVGDTPEVRSSRGTTRILLRGATVYDYPESRPKKDEHTDEPKAFGGVYVNDAARAAFADARRDPFPVGSIIVREKLARADAAQAQLLAVMVKRAPGFNPEAGDWEFLIADGALAKVRERQKRGSCLDCHAAQRAHDFVFSMPMPK
jgi:hypothetical protein